MQMKQYNYIQERTRGCWPVILKELGGLSPRQLKDRHQPCPLCGGRDRYRFDNLKGDGTWYCSQCGKDGKNGGGNDGITLLMRLNSWTLPETLDRLEQWLDGARLPDPETLKRRTAPPHPDTLVESTSESTPLVPVPDGIPVPSQPRHMRLGTPQMLWPYYNGEGQLMMFIARFQSPGSDLKEVLPYTLWQKESKIFWRWKALPEPRPLYGLDHLAQHPSANVLIVEGEKTADSARRLLPEWVVVTWPGGCKAIKKIDWSPLRSRSVAIWPDADPPGQQAALHILKYLKTITHKCDIVQVPDDCAPGWDLADAEKEGWDTQRTEEWISNRRLSHNTQEREGTTFEGLPAWSEKPCQSTVASSYAPYYKDKLTYDPSCGRWYEWNKTVWMRQSEALVKRKLSHSLQASFKQAGIGFSYAYLSNCLQMLGLELATVTWNQDSALLPLENGILDVKTKVLRAHSSTDYITWQLPYAYDPTAQCPLTKAWLAETTHNDAGMLKVLQAWLNAVIKGRVDLHRYLELIGPAGTGKSTFLRLAMGLVGEMNTVTTDLKQLEQNRFESASLYGMRLCLITDSSRYGGSVDVLKAITGGDPLRYEEKYCPKGNSFIPQCLVMIAANEPIQAADYTSGLQRRRLTLPFTHRIPAEKRDAHIETRLHQELPGLLNWVLELDDETVAKLLRMPETQSECIAATTKSNMTDTNPLAAWLDECVLYMPNHFTRVGVLDQDGGTSQKDHHLYPNYVHFCNTTGHSPLAQRRFSNVLLDLCESLDYSVKRIRKTEGWMFKGLALKYGTSQYIPSMVTHFTSTHDE